MRYPMISLVILSAVQGLAAFAAEPSADSPSKLSAAEQVKLTEQLADSMVRIEYELKYDKGQPPQIDGYVKYCPHCGSYHSVAGGESLIEEERPLETGGYVLAPDLVICDDVMVHPRFVKRITVVYKDQRIEASLDRIFRKQCGICLKLSRPLREAKVLEFKPSPKGPYYVISYEDVSGQWCRSVSPLDLGGVTVSPDGNCCYGATARGIVTDPAGSPVGMLMSSRLPVDQSWQGSPLEWEALDAKAIQAMLERMEAIADAALLRVKINFRSPRSSDNRDSFMYRSGDDEEATEMYTLGVLIEEDQVLVPETLGPQRTARLERITVYDAQNHPVSAKFVGNMNDYGALICRLDKPMAQPVQFSGRPVIELRDEVLAAVEVAVMGEERVRYIRHRRIPDVQIGWKGKLFPSISEYGTMGDTEDATLFLFTTDGRLTCLPMAKRKKIETDDYGWYGRQILFFPACDMQPVLADLSGAFDPDNVPLSEAEESRIAWLGVELQELDEELARINGVSEWTQNGRTGGLVSYIYTGSPAEEAGVQMGDVLIRLHVPDRPRPIDIESEESYFSYGLETLFEQLDEIPAEYLSQLPVPWPSVDNTLNRTLTNIGFGKTYTADFSRGGELYQKEFTVMECPAHYDSAPRYKSESLGMTVRNLTFEVRRFLQLSPDDPGVIISKLEPGMKAFISGIRPYEIVTHINDEPVRNVEDFKKAIGQAELKIGLKRMTTGRVVRISHEPPAIEAGAPAQTDESLAKQAPDGEL